MTGKKYQTIVIFEMSGYITSVKTRFWKPVKI